VGGGDGKMEGGEGKERYPGSREEGRGLTYKGGEHEKTV